MRDGLKRVRSQRKSGPTQRKRPSMLRPALISAGTILAACAAIWGVFELAKAPSLHAARVEVSGQQRLPAESISAVAEARLGEPLLYVDLEELRAQVEELAGVEQASVARHLPDTLDVRIVEREAIARLSLGKRELLVDRHGALFGVARGLETDAALPALVGLKTGSGAVQISDSDRAALEAIIAFQEISGRSLPAGSLIDLSQSDRVELRTGETGWGLYLDRQDPRTNLEHLFALEAQVSKLAQGRAIDLRFPNRITLVPARNARARRVN